MFEVSIVVKYTRTELQLNISYRKELCGNFKPRFWIPQSIGTWQSLYNLVLFFLPKQFLPTLLCDAQFRRYPTHPYSGSWQFFLNVLSRSSDPSLSHFCLQYLQGWRKNDRVIATKYGTGVTELHFGVLFLVEILFYTLEEQ
jgi:hypothetical protein